MNAVDLIIILFALASIPRGIQSGLLELFLSFTGLMTGLLIGSRLAQIIAVHMGSPLAKLVVILALECSLALLLWMGGLVLSRRLRPHPKRKYLNRANEIAGGVTEVLFTLIIVWLIASGLTNVRSHNIGHNVRRSLIVRELNSALPHPPDIIAQLEKIVSPNGFPNVFLGLEPGHTTVSPKNKVNNQAVLDAEKSVVRVQGIGCGNIVYGSGFVADKGIVVTNAHVVAGLKRPQVVDSHKIYQSQTIWFDENLDIAILKVNGLPDPPLTLNPKILPDADAAATLGYPQGGQLVAEDAAIIDHVTAVGRNIYNEGIVSREIYEVQTKVEEGDSGGPLLAPDGSVAGVLFARAVSQDNIGYALLINQIIPLVSQAKQRNQVVDTSFCTD